MRLRRSLAHAFMTAALMISERRCPSERHFASSSSMRAAVRASFAANVLLREVRCRVTGVSEQRHLRASHIKPWRSSTDSERLNGANGLLLSPHIDHLFDQGLLTFTADQRLLVVPEVEHKLVDAWGIDLQRTGRSVLPRTIGVSRLSLHQRLQEGLAWRLATSEEPQCSTVALSSPPPPSPLLCPLALSRRPARSAELLIQRTVKPVVISDYSGFEFTNGGPENCVSAPFG